MSLALVTRGYVAPSVAGGGGGGGSSGIRIFFSLRDDNGDLQAGVSLSSAGETQVSDNGAGLANRVGSAPTSVGGGLYYYELDESEITDAIASQGSAILKIVKAGYATVQEEKPIIDYATQSDLDTALTTIANDIAAAESAVLGAVATVAADVWDKLRAAHTVAGSFGEGVVVSSLSAAALTAVRDKILDYSHRPGRTVRGWIRRADASIGNAKGLLGTLVRFFAPDGTTEEVRYAQNPVTGERTVTDVTNSETP